MRMVSLLRRETSGGAFVPEVDGLRFFAVVLVFLFHLDGYVRDRMVKPTEPIGQALSTIFAHGFVGVQLFFAISGFVLALPFAENRLPPTVGRTGAKPVSLGKYFLRRVTRLEPPYLINLAVTAVALALIGRESIDWIATHTLASAVYLHNVIYTSETLPNPVTWSLEIEVQFYVLAPLLSLVFLVRNAAVRRAILVATVVGFGVLQGAFEHAIREGIPDAHGQMHGLTVVHQLHYFLVGFLLADLYVLNWKSAELPRLSGGAMLWDVAAVAAWVLMFWSLMHNATIHLVVPWMCFVLGCGMFRGYYWRNLLRSPWLYIIGGMCYTIYLYHPMFISLLGRVTARLAIPGGYLTNYGVQLLILGSVTVVGCSVLFLLFEKPFMRRDWPVRVAAWLGIKSLAPGVTQTQGEAAGPSTRSPNA